MIMKIFPRRYACPAAAFMTAFPVRHSSAFTSVPKRSAGLTTLVPRLYSSIAPEEAIVTQSTISGSGSSSSSHTNNHMFDGEVLSFTKNLVAVRVSDAQNQVYSAAEATKEVSAANAGPNKVTKRDDDMTGKIVYFQMMDGIEQQKGVIVCQRPPIAFVLLTDDLLNKSMATATKTDDQKVLVSDQKLTVKVSDNLLGKLIDCFGNVIDTLGSSSTAVEDDESNNIYERAIFATIPQLKDISLINKPLLTGNAMCDALAPIGRGQNMLIIGQKNTGKRDIVIDAIANQIQCK